MNYLLDTNLVSEVMKASPDQPVVDWIRRHDAQCFLSVITLAEIDRGILLLADGKRKVSLQKAAQNLVEALDSRILAFDQLTARRWAALTATAERQGRKLPVLDSMIEAIALEWQMTLVTRNTSDFFEVPVFNPFSRPSSGRVGE